MLKVVIDDERCFKFDVNDYYRTKDEGEKFVIRAAREKLVIDELWLDHDLGFSGTIRPVVLLMEEIANDVYEGLSLTIEQIYIHTANPSGSDWMFSTLHRYWHTYRVPWTDVNNMIDYEAMLELEKQRKNYGAIVP